MRPGEIGPPPVDAPMRPAAARAEPRRPEPVEQAVTCSVEVRRGRSLRHAAPDTPAPSG